MAAPEPFVVGSTHLLQATIKDVVDGVASPLSLAGATVTVRVLKPDGTVVSWAATPDADQAGAGKGKATYKLAATDLTAEGLLKLQARVVVGADAFVSKIVSRYAVKAIA